MNERARRLVVVAEAKSLGHGEIVRVAQVSEVSISTIQQGLLELKAPGRRRDPEVVRRPG